jgi:hypothetical protein
VPDVLPRAKWPNGYALLDEHSKDPKSPFPKQKVQEKMRKARVRFDFPELRPADILIMLATAELAHSDPPQSTQSSIALTSQYTQSYVSSRFWRRAAIEEGTEPHGLIASGLAAWYPSKTGELVRYRLTDVGCELLDRVFPNHTRRVPR